MFTKLSSIATASLGYKSLQNDFFYVNQSTIDTYGIEAKFLRPIFKLSDLDSKAYLQNVGPRIWIFYCQEAEADLRGTGALRYIRSMADRRAKERKQAAGGKSIQAALSEQGGKLWYAPKAVATPGHTWLRKAISGVFSPFLFETADVIDQRCNRIEPLAGYHWKELAASLTTSLFAYATEINGSMTLGDGALEAPTTKLRDYPVLDLGALSTSQRKSLVVLAEAVWKAEAPVDWSSAKPNPGSALRELDAWVLSQTASSVSVDTLHNDLTGAINSRISVAKDKAITTKARSQDSLSSVAKQIADRASARINQRQFPESFINGPSDGTYSAQGKPPITITMQQLLSQTELSFVDSEGKTLVSGMFSASLADLIVRCALWNRSIFSLPNDERVIEAALAKMRPWFQTIRDAIEREVASSALGTAYIGGLREEVYKQIGIHPNALDRDLPKVIVLQR